jgi:D-threonine aldolase
MSSSATGVLAIGCGLGRQRHGGTLEDNIGLPHQDYGHGVDIGLPRFVNDLRTPALLLDVDAFEHNVALMAERISGARLRPHVKAHKTTELARRQMAAGHRTFTCATTREVEGMAAAGLGEDLMLANEVVDARRLGDLVRKDLARVTLAIDSDATLAAAVSGGVREVVIDVNIGLPRCGCDPADAGRLAGAARQAGLSVRGVMGYEGHLMMVLDEAEQRSKVEEAMALLLAAHADVGGDLISAGGTGTHMVNTWANEIQAGSYALMDTQYAEHPTFGFRQALSILGSVISVNSSKFAVADVGLKAQGMDHGLPTIPDATVWFCSDEHVTFAPTTAVAVGDRVRVIPAHCDPTVAYHEQMWLVRGDEVLDMWPVDLRGW